MRHYVTIEEHRTRFLMVEADSELEAVNQAHAIFSSGSSEGDTLGWGVTYSISNDVEYEEAFEIE